MGIVLSLSGGMDSAVLLDKAKREDDQVLAVSFCYDSKHNAMEYRAIRDLIHFYQVEHRSINLTIFTYAQSALMRNGPELPKGHYADPAMKATIIPGRNMIFASSLIALAQQRAVGSRTWKVWMGMHAGDHAIYPDCRIPWVDAIDTAAEIASEGSVAFEAPFMEFQKKDIVKLGLQFGVPFHMTHTCYNGWDPACGKCGSCQERLEAFFENGIQDPIKYESRELLPRG